LWLELSKVFNDLSVDDYVRAVVLSGSGKRAFSAGLDISWAMNDRIVFNPLHSDKTDGARRATKIRRFAAEFQDCVSAIERCEKRECVLYEPAARAMLAGSMLTTPLLEIAVICILHGISLGISIDISTCADIRICTSDVQFSVTEVDIGLAADVGTLTRLPKVVNNYSWVKEVCLTARTFGADEAYRVGFVSKILSTKEEAIEEALKLAVHIASKSPVAVQGTKNFLDWSRDHTVADGKHLPRRMKCCGLNLRNRSEVHRRVERRSTANRGYSDSTQVQDRQDSSNVRKIVISKRIPYAVYR